MVTTQSALISAKHEKNDLFSRNAHLLKCFWNNLLWKIEHLRYSRCIRVSCFRICAKWTTMGESFHDVCCTPKSYQRSFGNVLFRRNYRRNTKNTSSLECPIFIKKKKKKGLFVIRVQFTISRKLNSDFTGKCVFYLKHVGFTSFCWNNKFRSNERWKTKKKKNVYEYLKSRF